MKRLIIILSLIVFLSPNVFALKKPKEMKEAHQLEKMEVLHQHRMEKLEQKHQRKIEVKETRHRGKLLLMRTTYVLKAEKKRYRGRHYRVRRRRGRYLRTSYGTSYRAGMLAFNRG